MFTSFSLFKSYPIPDVDHRALLWFLSKYEQTPDGIWMKTLNWREVQFKYCWAMTNGIMGAWLAVLRKNVYLAPEYAGQDPVEFFKSPILKPIMKSQPASLSFWAGLISSTAVHELRHKYQRKRLGLVLYMLCTLPVLRQFTLEREASEIAKSTVAFFDAYMSAVAQNEFEIFITKKNERGE